MTKPATNRNKILKQIAQLASEIEANEEENREMQSQIDDLYKKLDELKTTSESKPCK